MAASRCFIIIVLSICLSGIVWSQTTTVLGPNSYNSKLLTKINGTALDITLHIDVLERMLTDTDLTTTASTLNLESVIRAEIHGDWERSRLVLQLVNQTRTVELKWAIYSALWQELQQSPQIYNYSRLLDFYTALAEQQAVPVALKQQVYHSFIVQSAHLLAAPCHTTNRSAEFPLVNKLMQRLSLGDLDTLRDIFSIVYDILLSLETPLTVAQCLGSYAGNLNQRTAANLQLLSRPEIQKDESACLMLQENLRQLLRVPNFQVLVEESLRQQLYAQLPNDETILFTAGKICIRNVTNANAYIYECPETYLMCTNAHDPKKAAFYVNRATLVDGSMRFAFRSAYWRNRYILMEPPTAASSNYTHAITKNVFSRDTNDWWRVVNVNEGVALYDGATAQFVLCGGAAMHWDGEEHHVYTRNARDFALYRRECVWRFEDCTQGGAL